MGNHNKKTAFLIFGVLTAAIITVSQLFSYQSIDSNKKETKTEKHSEEPSSAERSAFIAMTSGSVLASIQSHLHQEVIFLFEIFFQEDESYPWIPEVPVALGKYFQTLFHIIIAPNAP